jgi:hypothetical protein
MPPARVPGLLAMQSVARLQREQLHQVRGAQAGPAFG